MTPKEAVKLLDQAISPMKGSREEHLLLLKAITTLEQLCVKIDQEEELKKPLEVPATCKG